MILENCFRLCSRSALLPTDCKLIKFTYTKLTTGPGHGVLLRTRHRFVKERVIRVESFCTSRPPLCLRSRSTAACLLGLRVRIPPEECLYFVSVVCCQIEVSASDWSPFQRTYGVSVIEEPHRRGLGPLGAFEPLKKEISLCKPRSG